MLGDQKSVVLSTGEVIMKDSRLQSIGSQRAGHDSVTEQQE